MICDLCSARGGLAYLFCKCRSGGFLHRKSDGDAVAELGVIDNRHCLKQKRLYFLIVGIGRFDRQHRIAFVGYDLRRFKSYLCTVCICTHKSACTKEYAAEISCNDYTAIGSTAFLNDIQYRHACCALRLTVVGVAGDAAAVKLVGVTVVGGIPMLVTYLFDKFESFLFGLYWKRATRPAVWASFAFGILLMTTSLFSSLGVISISGGFLGFVFKNSLYSGVFAMLGGLIIMPTVSLLTKKCTPEGTEEIFSCYDAKVTVPALNALDGDTIDE